MKSRINYKLIEVHGVLYQEKYPGELRPWTLVMAKVKYGSNVTDCIKSYIDFTCEPSHTHYRRIINKEYNRYHKLHHEPKEGSWDNIKKFLIHIFGSIDLQMPLEYFWNLYINPKQKLPFLGLVSEKKGTGKSTLLNLLSCIFEKNASVVSSYDFLSQFNDHYVNSLIIMSDEHSESKDRKKIAEKLKMLITEEIIRVEAKHKAAFTTSNYLKIVFAGNNEEMLTIIEPENTRYWIVRVGALQNVDLDILDKMKKEIPAFLYFLKNTFQARPKRDRLYFLPDEFQTNAVKLIQHNSKSLWQRKIEDYLKLIFEEFNVNEVFYTPKDLAKDVGISYSSEIVITLKKCFNMSPEKDSKYHKIGCRELQHNSSLKKGEFLVSVDKTSTTGRYYTFLKEQFT